MSNQNSIESLSNESFEKAYRKVLPELEAMGTEDLVQSNLDLVGAATTVLGVIPELSALRARIAKLPEFDLERFDRLADYAGAAAYAQTVHMVSVQPPDDLRELLEEGTKLREVLFAEANLLVLRGVINIEALRDIRRGTGRRILLTDLQLLVNVFKANFEKIEGKVGTTREELEAYSLLVFKMAKSMGLREQGPDGAAHTALMRDRAFTLFIRTYERTRRAVGFLVEDADSIIPSLYKGRARRKATREEEKDSVTLVGLGPTTPSPTPVVQTPPKNPDPAPATNGVRPGGPFMA